MMRRRTGFEIFSLSFLDIISCAFGAIVMLILISKNDHEQGAQQYADLAELSQLLSSEQQQLENAQQTLAQEQTNLDEVKQRLDASKTEKASVQQALSSIKTEVQKLNDVSDGLQIAMEPKKKAALKVDTAKKRDESVGGIAVDSEYVIFILDTSGSMQRIWGRLLQEMQNILDIHPKVKGFQVMNDMGKYLLSGTKGRWLKDTPGIRKSVLKALSRWNSHSNSSPVEGLTTALKTYAKPGVSLSIYILGDEYSGSSFDPVINTLNKLNSNKITGKRLARVHAVGFVSDNVPSSRYSTLMQIVARQNNGTFIALPRR
jgi:uncharacterized protein YlxW (UPF0749 family)